MKRQTVQVLRRLVASEKQSQRIGANVLNRSKIAESFNGGKLDGHESRQRRTQALGEAADLH